MVGRLEGPVERLKRGGDFRLAADWFIFKATWNPWPVHRQEYQMRALRLHIIVLAAFGAATLLTTAPSRAEEQAAEPLPLEEIRLFADVYERIRQDYVESVDSKELIENAIRGMLVGLDPHSAYLDAEAFREMQIDTSGKFGGLGIEVGMEDGFVKVIAPIDDTPASRAGIEAGDLIIRLDDTPVQGMGLDEAITLMRGEIGAPLTLTIVREGREQPFTVTLIRSVITVRSVRNRMLEPGFGYVRISQFQSETGRGLAKAIASLRKEAGGSLKGMVLDLRNNPGGVLSGAVEVSDAFLNDGLIVYTEGRVTESRLRFSATPGDLLDGAPLVLLVNGGSASASEIVAGALQDHARALLMGSSTFGKGSVQTIVPIGEAIAVKMTTARYYTPAGRSIQAEGIVPDIVLPNATLTAVKGHDLVSIKEADLRGHIENGNGETESSAPVEADETAGLIDDYPLHEALNLLKGLNLLARPVRE